MMDVSDRPGLGLTASGQQCILELSKGRFWTATVGGGSVGYQCEPLIRGTWAPQGACGGTLGEGHAPVECSMSPLERVVIRPDGGPCLTCDSDLLAQVCRVLGFLGC